MTRTILKVVFFFLYSLIVVEIVFRLILAIDPIFVRILDFDSTSERLRWIKRHEDVDILYTYEAYSPTLGWALQPSLKNKVIDGKVLNTNSHGLRGRQDYDNDKGVQKRIIVLGDSFTFGMDVSDDETYAGYLDQLLPQVEVLNFGVPGYAHDQMLIYFQQEGIKYQPDVVIIGFVYLDLTRNTMSFKNYAKPKFELGTDGHLYLTNVPVPSPEETLQAEFFRLKSIDLLKILQFKISALLGVHEREVEEISAAILSELIHSIQSSGAKPVLVYLPINLHSGQEEKFFTMYCQRHEIACLSLQERVSQSINSDAEFRSYTNHWQPEVHKIVAEGIMEYLINENIFSNE